MCRREERREGRGGRQRRCQRTIDMLAQICTGISVLICARVRMSIYNNDFIKYVVQIKLVMKQQKFIKIIRFSRIIKYIALRFYEFSQGYVRARKKLQFMKNKFVVNKD